MGSQLVSTAFAFIREHNRRAREQNQREIEITEVALLVLMANTALDSDREPSFWVKRSEICAQLGIRDTEAGRKRVQRAIGALAAAGAVAVPERYQRGHTPRYRLIYQGGWLASIPSGEVWTPNIPPNASKGDAQRPKYGRPASPGVDAQHPPEEGRGTEEEGAARADSFELHAPPPPTLPDIPTGDSPYCSAHPGGTTMACSACGRARRAHEANEHARESRRRQAAKLRHRIVGGRRICDNREHQAASDGTCINCDIHADDLAALLTTGATA